MLGDVIVLAVLAGVIAWAVRSLWKAHKNGGGCSGDCSGCGGCSRCGGCRPKP